MTAGPLPNSGRETGEIRLLAHYDDWIYCSLPQGFLLLPLCFLNKDDLLRGNPVCFDIEFDKSLFIN